VNLTRVVVVGTSCSGKTTLARRLARILATDHVELDSLYWGPEWTPRPDFIQNVLAIAQQPRWVIASFGLITLSHACSHGPYCARRGGLS